jgi:hypothetical protein
MNVFRKRGVPFLPVLTFLLFLNFLYFFSTNIEG